MTSQVDRQGRFPINPTFAEVAPVSVAPSDIIRNLERTTLGPVREGANFLCHGNGVNYRMRFRGFGTILLSAGGPPIRRARPVQ